tara:strand:- start:2507 stop:2743 length:237 start_codon:yes stop_codon:yes gene_type:complete
MRNGFNNNLSTAFKGLINQFDADLLQVIAWDLEDQIGNQLWAGDDLEKAKVCLVYIQNELGVKVDATATLIKQKICLN